MTRNIDNEDASIAQEISPSLNTESSAEVLLHHLHLESETRMCLEEKGSIEHYNTRQHKMDRIPLNLRRRPLASSSRISPVGKHGRDADISNASLKLCKLDCDSGCDWSRQV